MVGDYVLKSISNVILQNLRKIDFPCRYGGDEILIMLPQVNALSARITARRLSNAIRKIKIPVNRQKTKFIGVTVSQGISIYPDDAKSAEELIQKADDALYWVKTHGRNKIALYGKCSKAIKKK